MADILAAITSVSSGLEQSIKLIQWIKRVANSAKDLERLLDRHFRYVSSTVEAIRSVESEDALQSPDMESPLKSLKEAVDNLNKELMGIQARLKERGRTAQILRAMIQGEDGEDTLRPLVIDLNNAKDDLLFRILVAGIGLTRDADTSVKVNTDKLQKLEEEIKRLGINSTNQFTVLMEERPRTADGYLMISKDDMKSLLIDSMGSLPSRESTDQETGASSRANKVIMDNQCGNGYQFSAPTAEQDSWKGDNVYIIGNKVEDGFQNNHPIPVDVLLEAIKASASKK